MLTRTLWWWEYGLALDNSNVTTNAEVHVDIALGANGSTSMTGSKRIIISNHSTLYNSNEVSWRNGSAGAFAVGVTGEKIYARAQCSGPIEKGTYSIGVVGIGGGAELTTSIGYSRARIVNS
jgi:hypothetical protein